MVLLAMLRDRARFTLRTDTDSDRLPHGKAMRIQVGGVRGLSHALCPDAAPPSPLTDVYGLIEAALEKFGTLDSIPFSQIMQQIAAFRGRSRAKQR